MKTMSLHPVLADSKVRGLVFDLDGTLIHSAPDIIQSLRLTLEQAGFGRLPEDYFPDNLHGTSMGILRSIMTDMGWEIPGDLSGLRENYLANYKAMDHGNTHLYPGVLELLDACKDAGLSLGICTNKVSELAMTALEKVGLNGVFDFVSGADTWANAKPSPVPLLETIRMLGLNPDQCLYFGDTSVDAICAHAAGIPFILHEAGYGDAALHVHKRLLSIRCWRELVTPRPTAPTLIPAA